MTAISIGANLTAKHPHQIKQTVFKMLEQSSARSNTKVNSRKFFTKAGAPVASTAADSPGSDNCWILDVTNTALYFVYSWADDDNFDVVVID